MDVSLLANTVVDDNKDVVVQATERFLSLGRVTCVVVGTLDSVMSGGG